MVSTDTLSCRQSRVRVLLALAQPHLFPRLLHRDRYGVPLPQFVTHRRRRFDSDHVEGSVHNEAYGGDDGQGDDGGDCKRGGGGWGWGGGRCRLGSVRVHFAVFFSTDGYFSKKAQRLLGVTRERSRVARTPRRCGAWCAGAPGGFAKPSTRSPPRIRIEEDARCSLKTARRRKQSVRAQGDLSWACGGKKNGNLRS